MNIPNSVLYNNLITQQEDDVMFRSFCFSVVLGLTYAAPTQAASLHHALVCTHYHDMTRVVSTWKRHPAAGFTLFERMSQQLDQAGTPRCQTMKRVKVSFKPEKTRFINWQKGQVYSILPVSYRAENGEYHGGFTFIDWPITTGTEA